MVQVFCGWVHLPLCQINDLATFLFELGSSALRVFHFERLGNGSACLGSKVCLLAKKLHSCHLKLKPWPKPSRRLRPCVGQGGCLVSSQKAFLMGWFWPSKVGPYFGPVFGVSPRGLLCAAFVKQFTAIVLAALRLVSCFLLAQTLVASVCISVGSMSEELAELQRKIANLQRRLRRAGKRKQVRADKIDNQSLVLFIFSGHRADIAAHFHLTVSGSFLSLDNAVAHVEWCYIKAPLEHKVRIMLDPSSQLSRSALLPPFRFLLLFQLREWVQKMNHEFGIAPSRCMLCEHLRELMPPNLPAELSARLLRPLATARSQRKYFSAFRKRFRCKLGRLRTSPPMPLQEKQSKVGMGQGAFFGRFCFVNFS